jgi:hypothetical protein
MMVGNPPSRALTLLRAVPGGGGIVQAATDRAGSSIYTICSIHSENEQNMLWFT